MIWYSDDESELDYLVIQFPALYQNRYSDDDLFFKWGSVQFDSCKTLRRKERVHQVPCMDACISFRFSPLSPVVTNNGNVVGVSGSTRQTFKR